MFIQKSVTKTRFIALFVAFQLLTAMFLADFHLSFSEHQLGEKPHIHFSFDDHDHHHHDSEQLASLSSDVEPLVHQHDHASEIHIHFNLIEAKTTVQTLISSPHTEIIPAYDSAIRSFGQKPLLPPPTA